MVSTETMTWFIGKTPPQAQFEAEQDGEYTLYDPQDDEETPFSTAVEIEHNGGEEINTENIRVTVDRDPVHVATDETEQELGGPSSSDHPAAANPWYDKDTISSGDEARIFIAGTYIEDYDAVVDPVNEDRVLYRGDEPDLYINTDADSPYISNIGLEEGQTLRIIWESGEQSQTLYEYEIR